MKKFLVVPLFFAALIGARCAADDRPLRLAIVGLVHDHADGFIPSVLARKDVQLVGVVEPDETLANAYATHFNISRNLFFASIPALAAKTPLDAVAAFTTTADHRPVVETCAGLGIDVMMEKPMAANLADAEVIAAAAKKGGIQVVVNYETTWYPSNRSAYDFVEGRDGIGEIRKVVVHDGHQGPKAIGSSRYFLAWLADPTKSGGGAAMDFGCYGADLVTWLMKGERPTSVFSVFQHLQPEAYPRVEDDATLILSYPHTQAILQASWDWPYGRKDMEIGSVTS